jgi:aquaporin Z
MMTYVMYFVAEFIGAFVGAMLSWGCLGKTLELAVHEDFTITQHIFAEIFGTWILVHTILVVGDIKTATLLSPALSVGTTLFLIALSLGYVSGGAFNPAVGFGIDLADVLKHDFDRFEDVWIYFFGPMAGGVLAALVFFVMRPAFLLKYAMVAKSAVHHKIDETRNDSGVTPENPDVPEQNLTVVVEFPPKMVS